MKKTDRFFTVDPGKWGIGYAIWGMGVLEYADFYRGTRYSMAQLIRTYSPTFGVIEKPMVYPLGTRGAGDDPNDLIEVALTVGAVMSVAESTITAYPRDWKGTVPKEIHNKRVLAALTDKDKALIERVPSGLRHNVIDAIGLGLWTLSTEGWAFVQQELL